MNKELFKKAYKIISDVPAKVMNLDLIANKCGKNSCGTIACAAGWLAQSPTFKRKGLKLVIRGDGFYVASLKEIVPHVGLEFEGRKYDAGDYAKVMHDLFNMDYCAAEDLFGPLECSEKAWKKSHKEVWLRRARKFAKENDIKL